MKVYCRSGRIAIRCTCTYRRRSRGCGMSIHEAPKKLSDSGRVIHFGKRSQPEVHVMCSTFQKLDLLLSLFDFFPLY